MNTLIEKSGRIPRYPAILTTILASVFLSLPYRTSGFAGPGLKVLKSSIEETLEAAAKRSGRSLASHAGREALSTSLEKAAARHGTQVLQATRSGGLELIEAAAKHGDEVWNFARRVPEASRVLAVNAAELVPLARKYGDDVLRLEAREPGIAGQVVQSFGSEGLELAARGLIPRKDLYTLLRYAERPDSAETANRLLRGYMRDGAQFLERLPSGRILAYGLSAGMLTAAWNVSDSVGDAIEQSPGLVPETGRALAEELMPAFLAVGIGASLGILLLCFSVGSRFKRSVKRNLTEEVEV